MYILYVHKKVLGVIISVEWRVSIPSTFPMKKHLKSRNPALNINRRHKAVATDTVFSDTPGVDSRVKQAQVMVVMDSVVADLTFEKWEAIC